MLLIAKRSCSESSISIECHQVLAINSGSPREVFFVAVDFHISVRAGFGEDGAMRSKICKSDVCLFI